MITELRNMEEKPNTRKVTHFSDLEDGVLDDKYKNFVFKSSLTAVFITILLFILNPQFFDRLQYEDGYVENLTVIFLIIAVIGIGRYLIMSLKSDRIYHLKYLFVQLQIIGFLSVALYATLQELEFGQRAFGYEMSDTTKEVTKGNGMNLHHRENMELFLAFGAIIFTIYTVVLPYALRKPWINTVIPTQIFLIEKWILKIPRSLVPAFSAGAFLAFLQVISPLFTSELEEFNEYSEVCFAYAFALLGTYLWTSANQGRFN